MLFVRSGKNAYQLSILSSGGHKWDEFQSITSSQSSSRFCFYKGTRNCATACRQNLIARRILMGCFLNVSTQTIPRNVSQRHGERCSLDPKTVLADSCCAPATSSICTAQHAHAWWCLLRVSSGRKSSQYRSFQWLDIGKSTSQHIKLTRLLKDSAKT